MKKQTYCIDFNFKKTTKHTPSNISFLTKEQDYIIIKEQATVREYKIYPKNYYSGKRKDYVI